MSISSNKTISFKKNIFVGGEIQVNIKDIILSNFYKILNDKINISKSISNFDGVVDGALYFTFNNKGKLVPIEKNNSKIKIKKLIINSNTFDYDLSSIVFSLEVFQNEIVLKSYSNNDRNKYISVHCRDGYFFIKMKDFIVDKTHFAKIKQLFLDRTQFNILKNIELSWIANGDIEIPFDISSFARNSMFNFKFDILSADNDKIVQAGTEYGKKKKSDPCQRYERRRKKYGNNNSGRYGLPHHRELSGAAAQLSCGYHRIQ